MLRKAIVHIGPMKTGSTSIQAWLHDERPELLKAGFLFPASFGARNMSSLSYMAQAVAAGKEIDQADADKIAALREEIAGLPESVGIVVFSGEMIGQQLKTRAKVEAFKTLLDQFFDDYTIVLYLRRQDELSLSHYTTALRRGAKRARPFAHALDYERILNPWSEAFGREAIRARIFDRSVMPGGDVVRDFAQAAGLPEVGDKAEPIDRNPSILPHAQTFLSNLARRVKSEGFEGNFMDVYGHELITKSLNREFKGKGIKPARADAITYYDQVREANERVREAWFPDRATLFTESFEDYPVEGTPEPTAEQLLEVAMSALVAVVTGSASTDPTRPARGGRRAGRKKNPKKAKARARRERQREKGGGGRRGRAKPQEVL